jgi:hypothetical protein
LLGVGHHCVFDHLDDGIADPLDVNVRVEIPFSLQRVLAQIGRQISDPFEIGDDLERGGDKSEVACDGLLKRKQIDTVLL